MGGTSPCASCKLLRRRCAKDCVFAPYFPSDDPHKFAIVQKVFGASNVSKMLQELPLHQRRDAVSSLVYEASARARDPVDGCVGAISCLQSQVTQLQMQLAVARAEILCIQMQQADQHHHQQQQQQLPRRMNTHNQIMALEIDDDDDDETSYFIPDNLSHLLNFSANPNASVIYESFKKESFYGHDMVS